MPRCSNKGTRMSAYSTTALLGALPPHLGERCRILADAGSASGEFVLYWMHHSVRGHENPALDVASELAKQLGLALTPPVAQRV